MGPPPLWTGKNVCDFTFDSGSLTPLPLGLVPVTLPSPGTRDQGTSQTAAPERGSSRSPDMTDTCRWAYCSCSSATSTNCRGGRYRSAPVTRGSYSLTGPASGPRHEAHRTGTGVGVEDLHQGSLLRRGWKRDRGGESGLSVGPERCTRVSSSEKQRP